MGRPPISTSEHSKRGTFRPNRHSERADIAYRPGTPPEPEDVGDEGRRLWRDIVDATPPEALCHIDWAGLADCCRWWHLCDTYYKLVHDDPLEWKALQAYRDASAKFLSYMSRFGLSPVDRARIKAAPKSKAQDDDPMAAILKLKAAT